MTKPARATTKAAAPPAPRKINLCLRVPVEAFDQVDAIARARRTSMSRVGCEFILLELRRRLGPVS